MKAKFLVLVTMLVSLASIGAASAQPSFGWGHGHGHGHHSHFNRQQVIRYVHSMQTAIENVEATLGQCVLNSSTQHALEDAEELCELTERFHQRLENFAVSKNMLAQDFAAMADLAGHITELVKYDHALHTNWRLVAYWNQVDWYMHRIAFAMRVPYGHH